MSEQQAKRVPEEVLAYQRWLAQDNQRSIDEGYLFSKALPRFEPRTSDTLVIPPDLTATSQGQGVVVSSVRIGAQMFVPGVTAPECQKIIRSIDGQRTVAEVEVQSSVDGTALQTLLSSCFGSLLFAPRAVAELEQQVSSLEIVRFPGSPYEVVRAYWENAIDVARAVAAQPDFATDAAEFETKLRELHVTLLLGRGRNSFYRPASPITTKRAIWPGCLLESPAQVIDSPRGKVFVQGARVNATLLGGELYHRLLCDSLHDDTALILDRAVSDAQGLGWGQLVVARGPEDAEPMPTFCPPRPFQTEHWSALTDHFSSAAALSRKGDRLAVVKRLAHFHQCFVRLHPFQCGNQALAMALVNHVLRASHGAGMPHLLLDHFALRLSEPSYAELFSRAVRSYVVSEGSPIQRYETLRDRKQRSYLLIGKIAEAPSLVAAKQLIENDPEAARAALLQP